MQKDKHCGLIAIIGRPNVGKSTLMNHLLGQKISITSKKPQTTRYRINGIVTIDSYQYIFVDTPGYQLQHINQVNNLLNSTVINSLNDVDLIILVVEAGIFNDGDLNLIKLLPKNKSVLLVINKQDKLKSKLLLQQFANTVNQKFSFVNYTFVSAKHHLGITKLLQIIQPYLPQNDFLFPVDALTDKDTKFLVSEIIREKLFRYLGEELPYNLAVSVDKFQVEEKLVNITATIFVVRDSYKGIIIGENGSKLKKISTDARVDIEKLLSQKVFLQVWVKVKANIMQDPNFLKTMQ